MGALHAFCEICKFYSGFQNITALSVGILQKRKMTAAPKRGLISTRGMFSTWDDFIEAANQYFAQVKKWEKAGISHGDFFLGQPRDPNQWENIWLELRLEKMD